MAREAGWDAHHAEFDTRIEAFAELFRADEREACARVCEDSVEYAGDTLAEAIRARGKEPCVHEWIDDTKAKPAWRFIKCGSDYKKEQA